MQDEQPDDLPRSKGDLVLVCVFICLLGGMLLVMLALALTGHAPSLH